MGIGKEHVCCGVCCTIIILICVLIPLSIQNVDHSQYGIAYNNHTCTAREDVYQEGKHFIGPAIEMFKYNRIVVTIELSGDRVVECLTFDGIQIILDVTFQYQLVEAELHTVFYDFGPEYLLQDYIESTARDSVRDTCATKTAQNFYEERGAIEAAMFDALSSDMALAKAHVLIRLLQLKNVELPIELKTAIEEKQRSEQDIDNALNERAGAIINAQTLLETAKVEAETLIVVAEAEASAVLTEAVETSTAITQVFQNRGAVYQYIMMETNMSASTFVHDYLYAVVVRDSTEPVLAM